MLELRYAPIVTKFCIAAECRDVPKTGSRETYSMTSSARSEQRGWQLQAELPCSFLVHDQLKFGWGLNRQFGRIGATQDSINIGCCACDNLLDVHSV